MVGGSSSRPSAPSSLAYSAHFFAVCQPVPWTPATTMPRPSTAFTATWITLRRSSSVRASYSPSEPFGPTPRHPLLIRKSTCSANLSKSTARPAGALGSSLKGMVVATTTPPRSNFLVMVFLSWCRTGIRGVVCCGSVVVLVGCRKFSEPDRHRNRATIARGSVGEFRQLCFACEEFFDGAAADATLADSESGTGAQLERAQRLGFGGPGGRAQGAVADLLAPADDGRLGEPGRPAATDAVGRLDALGETGEDSSLAFEGGIGSGCPSRIVAREATFGEREVDSTDSGEFSDGIDTGDGGLLASVHSHEPFCRQLAPGGERKLETRGEGMADTDGIHRDGLLRSGNRHPITVEACGGHRLDGRGPVRGDHGAPQKVRDAMADVASQVPGELHPLARGWQQPPGPGQPSAHHGCDPIGFHDGDHARAGSRE